jgi:hypothetical protein
VSSGRRPPALPPREGSQERQAGSSLKLDCASSLIPSATHRNRLRGPCRTSEVVWNYRPRPLLVLDYNNDSGTRMEAALEAVEGPQLAGLPTSTKEYRVRIATSPRRAMECH